MKSYLYNWLSLFCILLPGCDDFVDVGRPRTELVRSTVFEEQSTAEAAVTELYTAMREGFASGGPYGLGAVAGLSSDELVWYGFDTSHQEFFENTISPNNYIIESTWGSIYNVIYKANAVIEGVAASGLPQEAKDQLTGEARFVRAFCNFYLVNLWGDVPLVTTTDYETNDDLGRIPVAQVYEQVLEDLTEAQVLLPEDYSHAKAERIRPNRATATALLSRVYVFLEDWIKAEEEATKVINNTELYGLESDLSLVFRSNSREAILQFWHYQYPNERIAFVVIPAFGGPLFASMRPEFATTFEATDARYTNWVSVADIAGNTFYSPNKYKSFAIPPEEYSVVLRLAEQFLIRAEARIRQNKLIQGTEDLNTLRGRAGLPGTTAVTAEDLLQAVMDERYRELFSEWGHRWFDLRRTGRADDVLSLVKPSWNPEDVFYPIPESQLLSNPTIVQNNNPG